AVAFPAFTGRSELAADDPPKQLPAAKKPTHKVIRVTQADALRPAEVSVAVNPADPDQVIAVSHQSGGQGKAPASFAYISDNGGASWKATPQQHMPHPPH